MNIQMIINKNKYWIIGIAGLLLFACTPEITFPDPGFDIKSDNEIEIRRDTADYYEIKLAMDVPNGVEKIEVLDGRDYTLIENISEYNSKKKFDFEYIVDISNIFQDTTLTYIIRVIDSDNRSFNRGFIIKVKKFSVPEIFLTGGNTIAVVAPAYTIKGLVTTGMYSVDSILIFFEGVLQSTITPDSLVSEYQLNETINFGNLEPNMEYLLIIIIVDSRGERSENTIKVIKGVFERPKRVIYIDNEFTREHSLDLFFNEESRLDSFIFIWNSGSSNPTHYSYDLIYDDNGNVTEISYMTYVTAFPDVGYYWYQLKNLFYYQDGTNKLDKMSTHSIKYYDSGLIEDNGENIEANQFVYREDGTALSFAGGRYISDIQYADGFSAGEKIFAEYWESYQFYDIIDQNRRYRSEFDPVFMPTYVYGLPPFVSLHRSQMVLFCDLFFHPYVFTNTERLDPNGNVASLKYSYSNDEQGKLVKFTRIEPNSGNELLFDYYFEY